MHSLSSLNLNEREYYLETLTKRPKKKFHVQNANVIETNKIR